MTNFMLALSATSPAAMSFVSANMGSLNVRHLKRLKAQQILARLLKQVNNSQYQEVELKEGGNWGPQDLLSQMLLM